jgi:hypothetical protein
VSIFSVSLSTRSGEIVGKAVGGHRRESSDLRAFEVPPHLDTSLFASALTWHRMRGLDGLALPQADAPALSNARHILGDEFHARGFECRHDFRQRVDDTANVAAARFHALDGRQGDACPVGKRLLIDSEKSATCTHLRGGNQARNSYG